MIGRLWLGCAAPDTADAYLEYLRGATLPTLREIAGHEGACVLRRDADGEVEFLVLTLWDSLAAVRAFAGKDYDAAVIPSEAKALLTRFDVRVRHYEVVITS
jgi:heme-degrading monooxygenase HmoA